MEKELLHLYDELIKVGVKKYVTGLAKKDLKTVKKGGEAMAKLYLEYKALGIEIAQEKAMEALDCLHLPGLKTRSTARTEDRVSCQRRCVEKMKTAL